MTRRDPSCASMVRELRSTLYLLTVRHTSSPTSFMLLTRTKYDHYTFPRHNMHTMLHTLSSRLQTRLYYLLLGYKGEGGDEWVGLWVGATHTQGLVNTLPAPPSTGMPPSQLLILHVPHPATQKENIWINNYTKIGGYMTIRVTVLFIVFSGFLTSV